MRENGVEVLKRLKELRKEHGETQRELAELLGLTDRAIANYETGIREPPLRKLKQLASHFNVSVDELIADIEVAQIQRKQPKSNLQKLRIEHGMTLDELSAEIGIPRASISQYERQERRKSMGEFMKLADYYNVSLDYLFDRTSEPSINRGDVK